MGDQGDTYGYRKQEEVEKWKQKCPINRLRKYLTQDKDVPDTVLEKIEKNVQEQIDEAVEFAKSEPFADPSEVYKDVYA